MSISSSNFIIFFVVLVILFNFSRANLIKRSWFAPNFVFGASSSAYQIEGAANMDGKGLSNWDFHTHRNPEVTWDNSTADIADDFYHTYKEDIKLMKHMGLKHFRLSISWTRILPKGNKVGGVNQLGINFYNNVIDELLANGIQPFVTLFHWDVPQALEAAYGGFLSPNIVQDFEDFADVCFNEFGDRVNNWVTINEPNYYAVLGYALGYQVPNRCTPINNSIPCTGGNSASEPYIVAHHLLLSHASAVALYRQKYQGLQNGTIGISVACNWVEPFDMKASTLEATKRYYEHFCGWFFNPLTYGDYPKNLRLLVQDRLPKFTPEQSNLLKNSFDFLGLNYYTASYIKEENVTVQHYELDDRAIKTFWDKDGKPIGTPSQVGWIFDYPVGLENLTLFLQKNYNNPVIIVTSNGYPTLDERNKAYNTQYYLRDQSRINFLEGHIFHLHEAIRKGANVKGYFVSSFLDSFEWSAGYLMKYGLYYVDRKSGLKRHIKDSGKWYQEFLHS